MMNPEQVLEALVNQIATKLPDELQAVSAAPLRWLHLNEDGKMEWKESIVSLPLPVELWAQQSPQLNFPAIMVHYTDTSYTRESDEDNSLYSSAHLFAIDLALTHDEPEMLVWMWLRYMQAIQNVVKKMNVIGIYDVQINAQRITETGPFDSIHLRRGMVEISVLI
jgi:hypothetical protein